MFLPDSWDDALAEDEGQAERIAQRRRRCAIPEQVRHRPKWQLALGEITALRLELTRRQIPYIVNVKGTTTAYPHDAVPDTTPYAGTGRPPVAEYRTPRSTLRELALAAGRRALRRVTWRRGSKHTAGYPSAKMTSRFLALRVRPANRGIARQEDGHLPECWLLAEWPPGAGEPTDYWLSTLPADTRLRDLVRLADRARLPRTEDRARPDPLRRPFPCTTAATTGLLHLYPAGRPARTSTPPHCGSAGPLPPARRQSQKTHPPSSRIPSTPRRGTPPAAPERRLPRMTRHRAQ
ncbi:transposase [Sphaerimonospora sp. CA-214678]|uniref:transposase n=1 Tax=Sphaerimonospora sp. CA-214678 TaxID=3240029 RepID=UPI003D91D80F